MRVALYVRVSTADQNLDEQRAELEREAHRRGWEVAETYAEKVSGVSSSRPALERLRVDAAMGRFRAVLVWAIDRVGRSPLEVLALAEELYSRRVGLVSLSEPAVDLTNPMGRLVLEIGAAFAGFERRRLAERTRTGMAGARARGAAIGRPLKVDPQRLAYLLKLNGGNVALTARQLGASSRTIARAVQRDKRGPNGG